MTRPFSSNFPAEVPFEIDRENILHTAVTILNGDTEILLIYGPDGQGKTTVLSQFAKTRSESTIAIFINTSSRFGYDPNLIQRDLCGQIWWFLHGKEQQEKEANLDELPTLIYKLQREATRRRHHFYFVIDGIDEIPIEDSHLRRSIIATSFGPTSISVYLFFSHSDDARARSKISANRSKHFLFRR